MVDIHIVVIDRVGINGLMVFCHWFFFLVFGAFGVFRLDAQRICVGISLDVLFAKRGLPIVGAGLQRNRFNDTLLRQYQSFKYIRDFSIIRQSVKQPLHDTWDYSICLVCEVFFDILNMKWDMINHKMGGMAMKRTATVTSLMANNCENV